MIGKDILKFHTVFWPAMLMAAELPVPEHVFVHGFLLGADGRKMSKSLGNVLDPSEVLDAYGADALRFYLMRDVPFGADGAVGMDAARPATSKSSPTSTATCAAARSRWSAVTATARSPPPTPTRGSRPSSRGCRRGDRADRRAEITAALEQIWQRVRRANRYVEERAPWVLASDPASRGELHRVLASLAEAVRVLSVLLSPFVPEGAGKLLDALGSPDLSLAGARVRAADAGAAGGATRAAVPETLSSTRV